MLKKYVKHAKDEDALRGVVSLHCELLTRAGTFLIIYKTRPTM